MGVHTRNLSAISERPAEETWASLIDQQYVIDSDFNRLVKVIDRQFLDAGSKLEKLHSLLKDATQQIHWVLKIGEYKKVRFRFKAALIDHNESNFFDECLLAIKIIRHRSLKIHWIAVCNSCPALKRYQDLRVPEIRIFLEKGENQPYFHSIYGISCEVIEPINPFCLFPRELVKLPNLQTMSLKNCGFRFLPTCFFENFHHLKYLNLNRNKLGDFTIPSLAFPSLLSLSLSENRIKNFVILEDGARELVTIKLINNPIEYSLIQGNIYT
jgi:hypothetical protein